MARKVDCPHCGISLTELKLVQHFRKMPCGSVVGKDVPKIFQTEVRVPNPSKNQARNRAYAMVHLSQQGSSTALELRRTEKVVTFIPYSSAGLAVERQKIEVFETLFASQPLYPTGRAAQLYLGFSQYLGATTEALLELEKLVDISPVEKEAATAKLSTNTSTRPTTRVVHAGKHGAVRISTQRKPKNSAAAMIKGLIMEGVLPDIEIYNRVAKEFEISNKRPTAYISWHRSQLKREGANPPKPVQVKGGKKP